MATVNLVQTVQGVQYDGTNSTEILAAYPETVAFGDVTPVSPEIGSEGGGVLVIHYDDFEGIGAPQNFTINEGEWIIPNQKPPLVTALVVPLSTLTNP
jgi:hypothetical protein